MQFCTDDHSQSFETENANASAFKVFLYVALERSFAMHFCSDDHSKSFETENANASAFRFILNVALERSFAMYFCTDVHSKSFETENANASAFKFFFNVALNTRSTCISVQMVILNLLKQRTLTPVRINSFKRCTGTLVRYVFLYR